MTASASALPKVLLIGDSIRMSYQEEARKALAGAAEVIWPEANCSSSVVILNNIRTWILTQAADVVHVNAGLHDLKTIAFGMPKPQREPLVPLPYYRQNVGRILRLIRTSMPAKVIWAATTPVHDENHHAVHARNNDFDRYDEDVLAYNAAALQVCREADVPVNDLYGVVRAAGLEKIQSPDGVHFNAAGAEVLGKAVAEEIRKAIAKR